MSVLTIGDVRIQCVIDGQAPFAGGSLQAAFPGVALEEWEPYRRRYPKMFVGDNWQPRFCGLLVETGSRTILVDTGLGETPDPYWGVRKGSMLAKMQGVGVDPEDVDIVFLTHLHADHVGWNVQADGTPTFPKARYLVHRRDWEAFHEPAFQNAFPFPYLDEMVFSLERLSALDLIDGEYQLADAVTAIPSFGHTPGHMSVVVASGGEKALIIGDALVNPAQVTEPDWAFVFDVDALAAAATRKELLDMAEAEGMFAMECHFPEPGHGRLVRSGGRLYWEHPE